MSCLVLEIILSRSSSCEIVVLQQTANVRHFVGYKNKIIDREIYYM